jgi:hypothetical protein
MSKKFKQSFLTWDQKKKFQCHVGTGSWKGLSNIALGNFIQCCIGQAHWMGVLFRWRTLVGMEIWTGQGNVWALFVEKRCSSQPAWGWKLG